MTNIIKFKKRYKSKHEIYSNAMNRVCDELTECLTSKKDNSVKSKVLKKVAYYGVMTVNTMPEKCDLTQLQRYFGVAEIAKGALSLLTYAELQECFPLDKKYDGAKYEWKDYFYSINVVNQYNPDDPILKNIDDLLWDYMSNHLFEFQAQTTCILSRMLRLQGKKGIAEQAFEDMGIDTYTQQADGTIVRNERKPNLTLVKG